MSPQATVLKQAPQSPRANSSLPCLLAQEKGWRMIAEALCSPKSPFKPRQEWRRMRNRGPRGVSFPAASYPETSVSLLQRNSLKPGTDTCLQLNTGRRYIFFKLFTKNCQLSCQRDYVNAMSPLGLVDHSATQAICYLLYPSMG